MSGLTGYGFHVFLAFAPIAGLMALAAAAATLPYRREITAQALLAYFVSAIWLLVTNIAELYAPAGPVTLLFAKLQYIGYAGVGLAWASFCLRFTGWITHFNVRFAVLAALIPAFILAGVMTNDWHHLFWRKIDFLEANGLSVLKAGRGPLFWAMACWEWGCIAFGTFLVLRSYLRGERTFYRQSLWVVAGALLPAVANVIYLLQLIPGLKKDFTPVAFALSGVLFVLGMYLHKLLWVMPAARGVILQNLPLGMVAVDSSGRVVDHNLAADQLLGLGADGVACVGRDIARYPHLAAIIVQAGLDPAHPRLGTGDAPQGTLESAGRILSWSIQPLVLKRHDLTVLVEDATERANLGAERDRLKDELVRNEKFAAIGQLVAGVAHEVNNPLAYLKSDLRSLTALCRRSLPEDDARRAEIERILAGMDEGFDRIGTTVGRLVDFARLGRPDAPLEPFDLVRAIDTTLTLCRSELRAVADVTIEEHGPLPPLRSRRNEIEQVILNILTNAAYAIRERRDPDEGRGAIVIRLGSDGDGAWCEIENDGPPLREADRETIFEPFFTTKPGDRGTGLGLSVSREIAESRHGGRLYLKTVAPVCFRLELPAG